ncbi:MAG: glycosyltransferase family 2 protein [Candidatus Roizmanbacteria bacterium]|nr:MAG: glycosyltransferase family 2 protein [Candidatus Roizmanbacteria bacterium]
MVIPMILSLCIAAYNEEKFIHYPLDSAYDLVDEVVIVDGGSTDKTVEIAQKYGEKVKIFHENNPPMFHINKQKALDKAKGEWILQLDADEALSKDLRFEIANLLQIQNSEFRIKNKQTEKSILNSKFNSEFSIHNSKFIAYWVPRKNYFLGRFLMKGGVYPDYTIRLYKNGKARFPCKSVHENVEVDGQIGYFKNAILHYADVDFNRYLARNRRYINVIAKEMQEKNMDKGVGMFINYIVIKPLHWFLLTQIRHKGILDGWQGVVFSFFSALRFPRAYMKYLRSK